MINTNNVNTYTVNTSSNSNRGNTSPIGMDTRIISEFRDEFVVENKKNGLIEKFYNFCKNKTGLGLGSNKVEQKIAEFENGKASEKEVQNKISDYKASQKNAEQNFGDFASAAIAISTYFKWSNFTQKLDARIKTKSFNPLIKLMDALTKLQDPKLQEELIKNKEYKAIKITKLLKPLSLPEVKKFVGSDKAKIAIIPLLMFLAGDTKRSILKLNRIGSKEFKVDNKNQLDKKELKNTKKELNRKRHKENFKNFYTGAFNGLLAPITAVAGGIVGVPAYILATSGVRFLTNNNDNKEKSFDNYSASLKNNIALNSLFALTLAVPAFKKAKYNEILGKNLENVVKKLHGASLHEPAFNTTQTAYEELENIMLNSPKIKNILSKTGNIDESIRRLTDENIFAVKFLQISNSGGEISSKLIENCPPSRSINDAQKEINRLLNSNKYKVSKLLGVGTVAESYLAKDKSGKEVCIKILKKGITTEKIQKDKEAFIKLINNTSQDSKSKQYLIKNIDNLADAILKEVDFENEMKAANKLKKSTTKADVVVPIEAKPGIYVMEKAPGISLDTLAKYYKCESTIKMAKLFKGPDSGKRIAECEKKIKELKAKSPDFNDFNLSLKEIKILLNKYIEVLVEQFTKVDKNGKTLHADIHPGNIFINLNALKSGKGKLYTLIDTGNTIDLTKEQAAASIKLTSFIRKGNVRDITKYILDGADLPQNMTQKEATKLVEQDLRTIFFDEKNKINSMDTDELFKLTNNILRKHNIIPSDSQLNLYKAKKSANNSLGQLIGFFFGEKLTDFIGSDKSAFNKTMGTVTDGALLGSKYVQSKIAQENRNLLQMSPKEALKYLRNQNNLKTNSEDYLTYLFKQDISPAN